MNRIDLFKALLQGASGRLVAAVLLVAAMLAAAMLMPLPAAAQDAPAADAVAAAAVPRFDIWEYVIEGNSVLPPVAIEKAVTPHLGPGRSMADVDAARAQLEAVYQQAGYLTVFVDVPEQRVDEGVVTLNVLEGQVGQLHVTGAQYHSPGVIRKQVPELAEGTVPDFNRVQQQLTPLNRTEDRRVQPILRPGRVPGTVDVDLEVKDELPLSGSIEVNNDHGRDTRPWRLVGTARWGNLFQRDHSLSLTAIAVPEEFSQSQVFVGNYSVPLEGGASFSAIAVYSNSSVASLGGTVALGDGNTLGLRWSWPFGQSASALHSFTAGLDYKDLREEVQFGEGSIKTPVRYLPMQMAWQGNFNNGDVRDQVNLGFVWAFRQILRRTVECPTAIGGVDQSDQFACKRSGADGGFAILRADWRHSRPLGPLALSLRFSAQGASQPLISAEQFAVGGSQSVRGYLDSDATGDYGLLGSIELASPNLARWVGLDAGRVSTLAFMDAARVSTIDSLPGQPARTPLFGAGVGLRVDTPAGLSASFDVARAFKPTPASPADSNRVHVRVGMRL